MVRCYHIEGLVSCKTRAIFGNFGDDKPSKCGVHKLEDMIDVNHKKCEFPDCKSRPTFGLQGSKIATKCRAHKSDNMEDLINKRCDFPGCKTRANFGLPGSKTATKCGQHKSEDMENIVSKTCDFPGCKTHPTFGLPGSKTATKCRHHKSEIMKNIKDKKCDFPGCEIQPSFGLPGSKVATVCSQHKSDTMEDVKHKKCIFPGCKTRANYGLPGNKNATNCIEHKSGNMEDIFRKKCTSCGLFRVEKSSNYLCGYCRPQTVIRAKKERVVKELLQEKLPNYKFVHNKQINNDCCLKYRPDFLFDCGSYFIVLECDEHAHEHYDKDCEITRMNNISSGLGLPTKFIRYNPDLKGIKSKTKQQRLIETLEKWLNMDFLEDPTALYLFYK